MTSPNDFDQIDGADRVSDRSIDDEFEDSNEAGSSGDAAARSEVGLEERLTGILVDGDDGDLLLQQSNREDRVLQWLQALDMQVMGACRADERLKPLLKINASNDVAEGRLLAQLTQHFEPAEVGMLARCFCIPLVSVRVGKIDKRGSLLCPTNSKGHLNLTVLPTSDLRLSFVGDDGHTDRLFTFNNKSQCSAVEVNEIAADNSGRSFVIKVPDGRVLHFWSCETSKLLGIELLGKMKDLLKRKPSIAELTGISESRLGCFATHLRAYLVGSTVVGNASSSVGMGSPSNLGTTNMELSDTVQDGHNLSTTSKSLRSRLGVNQAMKANSSFQGSLSPRSSSFKEGLPRTLSSLRNVKLRRRGDIFLSVVDDPTIVSPLAINPSCSEQSETDKCPEVVTSCLSSSAFLESLGNLAVQPNLNSASQVPYLTTPLLSPYYCWCPPGSSALQYPSESPLLPSSSVESALISLSPLSSLLSANMPSTVLTTNPPRSLADSPLLDFPAFFPDPLVRLPRPTSQQIPTFTPLMCEPIVHIPVMDICSSGPAYLVSAGPAISSGIPPLHPQSDSMMEKGARETLRRLLISGSTQSNSPLMNVLPAMLTNSEENHNMLVAGSRGLYSGTRDVDIITNSIAAMSLVSLSGGSHGGTVLDHSSSNESFEIQEEGSSGLGGSCSEDQGTFWSNFRVKRTDE